MASNEAKQLCGLEPSYGDSRTAGQPNLGQYILRNLHICKDGLLLVP